MWPSSCFVGGFDDVDNTWLWDPPVNFIFFLIPPHCLSIRATPPHPPDKTLVPQPLMARHTPPSPTPPPPSALPPPPRACANPTARSACSPSSLAWATVPTSRARRRRPPRVPTPACLLRARARCVRCPRGRRGMDTLVWNETIQASITVRDLDVAVVMLQRMCRDAGALPAYAFSYGMVISGLWRVWKTNEENHALKMFDEMS